MNRVGGIRQSTALTYLAQARQRPNLTIRSGVLIDNVLFEGRQAVGVRLARPADEVLYAERIILAAGSYGSPAILMRSGIGPAEHLKSLNIPVRVDLPGVGQSLIDHSLFGLQFAAPPAAMAEEPTIFFQNILTMKSSLATNVHDLHIIPCSAYSVAPEQSPTGVVYLLLVSTVKPRSRGSLRLRSPNPAEAPVIDPGYFTHPDDMARMIEAVRAARQLSRTPPLSELTVQELYPGQLRYRRFGSGGAGAGRQLSPSGEYLPHGASYGCDGGSRRTSKRAWCRSPIRNRCLDHASDTGCEYQPTDDYAGRTMLGLAGGNS
jgi:choline dehydrogenase